MSRSEDVKGNLSERVVLAPNAAYPVPAVAGQLAVSIKLLAGGTLEIGGQSQTIGTMYPISANEVVSQNNSGTFYLYASSATVTFALLRGRSAGYE